MDKETFRAYEVFTRGDVIQAWAEAANSALTFIARDVVRESAKPNACPTCGRVHECSRFPSES